MSNFGLRCERLLKKLRAKLIMSINDYISSSQLLAFQSALALQCFTNEYIYDKTKDEEKALLLLEETVKQANNSNPPSAKILTLFINPLTVLNGQVCY